MFGGWAVAWYVLECEKTMWKRVKVFDPQGVLAFSHTTFFNHFLYYPKYRLVSIVTIYHSWVIKQKDISLLGNNSLTVEFVLNWKEIMTFHGVIIYWYAKEWWHPLPDSPWTILFYGRSVVVGLVINQFTNKRVK